MYFIIFLKYVDKTTKEVYSINILSSSYSSMCKFYSHVIRDYIHYLM